MVNALAAFGVLAPLLAEACANHDTLNIVYMDVSVLKQRSSRPMRPRHQTMPICYAGPMPGLQTPAWHGPRQPSPGTIAGAVIYRDISTTDQGAVCVQVYCN